MQAGKCSLSLLVAVGFALGTVGEEPRTLRGFTTLHGQRELALEQTFLSVPDPARAEAVHKILTAEPHMAGSSGDRRTAEYVLQQFRSYGLEAEIEEFQAQVSEPREIAFQLLQPGTHSGPTPEHVDQDSSSTDRRAS